MKIAYSFLIVSLIFTISGFSQSIKSSSELKSVQTTPKAATIKISLIGLPGVKYGKSTWETGYELRILNENEVFSASKLGKFKQMNADREKVGELINKGSFTRKSLGEKANREAILVISFDEKIQARLEKEPKNRINISAVTLDKKNIEIIKEQQANTQVFLFYATAIVYDAKLKRNIIIPLSWIWKFNEYPDADFGMIFKIDENGDYSTNLVLPTKLKKSGLTKTIKQ